MIPCAQCKASIIDFTFTFAISADYTGKVLKLESCQQFELSDLRSKSKYTGDDVRSC